MKWVLSVTAAPGFEAGGLASGIKPSGAPDLAIVATADRPPVTAAGVFTTNLVAAAPVQVSRRHLADGRAAAVVLNSGNANAATGEPGPAPTRCACASSPRRARLRDGRRARVPDRASSASRCPWTRSSPASRSSPRSSARMPTVVAAAADAILTTDTVRKETVRHARLPSGCTVTVGGMAKGAAMLSPAMATMLAVLTTDAAVEPRALHSLLEHAVDDTFNALVVDGCRQHQRHRARARQRRGRQRRHHARRRFRLPSARRRARRGVRRPRAPDGRPTPKGPPSSRASSCGRPVARRGTAAARTVASSQLVQCSLYGCDPYWGRVLSELGASGAIFDPERVDIAYNGIVVCRDGVAAPHDDRGRTAMEQRDIEIACDLHAGDGDATMLFTDLTHAYVDENMGTS